MSYMQKKILILVFGILLFNTSANADIIKKSKVWKFLAGITNDAKNNFPEIPFLKTELEEGELKFGSSKYEGEIKKGKAHGYGIFTFADGTKYEGRFKKNMFHGYGVYIDNAGNIIEGKWKYNNLSSPINSQTREVYKLSKAFGKSSHFEVRGEGELRNKWFEAEITKVNSKELQPIKELDIFDTPSAFSKDYGDEKKIKEILDKKNAEIKQQNKISGKVENNLQTVYTLTSKGKQDMQKAQTVAASTATPPNQHGTMMGGGC